MPAKISCPKPDDTRAKFAAPSNSLPAKSVQPGAVAIALAAAAYFLATCRVTFSDGETLLVVAVVTLTLAVMFCLRAADVALSRIVEPHRRSKRSFGEFLDGDVGIETGCMTGHAAPLQIAAMPVVLVLGTTLILSSEVRAADDRAAASADIAANSVSGGGTTLRSVSVEFPDSERQFPGGHKADAINNNCLACHSAGMVLSQPRLSRVQWQSEVDKMRNTYKAPIAAEDVPAIVDYLANR